MRCWHEDWVIPSSKLEDIWQLLRCFHDNLEFYAAMHTELVKTNCKYAIQQGLHSISLRNQLIAYKFEYNSGLIWH